MQIWIPETIIVNCKSEARRNRLEADEMTLLRMCAIVVYGILTFWDCFISRNQSIWRIMECCIIVLLSYRLEIITGNFQF